MEEEIYKRTTEIEVLVVLRSGKQLEGTINMIDFKRFSDFIEANNQKHIKLYNATKSSGIKGGPTRFLLIPKASVDWYEPKE